MCAAAEPHRGLPLVDVRLHAHQLLFGRFLVAAAEEVSHPQAFTCRHLRPSLMTESVHEVSCCDALTPSQLAFRCLPGINIGLHLFENQ